MKVEYKPIDTEETEVFEFNNIKYYVLKYLPIQDKRELLNTLFIECADDNGYDPLTMEVWFTLLVVHYYADIDIDFDNPFDEYDNLMKCGFLYNFWNAILKIDKEANEATGSYYLGEISMLDNAIRQILDQKNNAGMALIKAIKDVMNNLPEQMEQMEDTIAKINEFDPKNAQAVLDFATAANGGRPIV